MSQKSFISKNTFESLETPEETMEDSSTEDLTAIKRSCLSLFKTMLDFQFRTTLPAYTDLKDDKIKTQFMLEKYGDTFHPDNFAPLATETGKSKYIIAYMSAISMFSFSASFDDMVDKILSELTQNDCGSDTQPIKSPSLETCEENNSKKSNTIITPISPSTSTQPLRAEDDQQMDTDTPADNQPNKGKSKSKSKDRQEKPAPKNSKKDSQNVSKNSTNKNTKKQDNNKVRPRVITGHVPTPEKEKFVRDVLVYDVPAAWSDVECLNQLSLWGTVISMSCKTQKKWQTLRVKIEFNSFYINRFDRLDWMVGLGAHPVRWFPGSWTLQERKKRESFQLAVKDIPDAITTDHCWNPEHGILTEFLSTRGVKYWKILKLNKSRKLVLFFENHGAKMQLKENGMLFGPPGNQVDLVLSDHGSPNLKKKPSKKKPTDRATEKKKEDTATTRRQKNPKKNVEKKGTKDKKAKERTNDKSKVIAEICSLLRSLV